MKPTQQYPFFSYKNEVWTLHQTVLAYHGVQYTVVQHMAVNAPAGTDICLFNERCEAGQITHVSSVEEVFNILKNLNEWRDEQEQEEKERREGIQDGTHTRDTLVSATRR